MSKKQQAARPANLPPITRDQMQKVFERRKSQALKWAEHTLAEVKAVAAQIDRGKMSPQIVHALFGHRARLAYMAEPSTGPPTVLEGRVIAQAIDCTRASIHKVAIVLGIDPNPLFLAPTAGMSVPWEAAAVAAELAASGRKKVGANTGANTGAASASQKRDRKKLTEAQRKYLRWYRSEMSATEIAKDEKCDRSTASKGLKWAKEHLGKGREIP